MDKLFSEWLNEQLINNSTNASQLAKKAGVSKQVLSEYLNDKKRYPDPYTLVSISRALNIPPEEIFRAAGLLPPKIEINPIVERITYSASKLETEDDQLLALELINKIGERREKYHSKSGKPLEKAQQH